MFFVLQVPFAYTQNESTDTDLQLLIQGIKHAMLKPEQVISADDAVSRAMSVTTVYVGEALLQQEGLLHTYTIHTPLAGPRSAESTSAVASRCITRFVRVRDRISATIRTRLQNLCITGAAAFSAKV